MQGPKKKKKKIKTQGLKVHLRQKYIIQTLSVEASYTAQIESLKLDFQVNAMWKKCHIKRDQNTKIKSQILDL